jgi:hypothetical protein
MDIFKYTRSFNLLSVGRDAKTIKNLAFNYLTGILYLAPHTQSGVMNLCPKASKGCAEGCLFKAGMGKFESVINARIERTKLFNSNKKNFFNLLYEDIEFLAWLAKKSKRIASIRLNGTSDYCFEKHSIFEDFNKIQFYDYTKIASRMRPDSKSQNIKNYHLTFSRSEVNQKEVEKVLEWGGNVSVVFRNELPKSWMGRKVIDGDESDCRNLDGKNVIVGLKAKGPAKYDKSGFVID